MNSTILAFAPFLSLTGLVLSIVAVALWSSYENVQYIYYAAAAIAISGIAIIVLVVGLITSKLPPQSIAVGPSQRAPEL